MAGDIALMMAEAEQRTQRNAALTLTIALNYGSRREIARAARDIAARAVAGELDCAAIDEDLFGQALNTLGLPDPDLLIRTSGEQRLSNFMLWQMAYTELVFLPVHWPDFDQRPSERGDRRVPAARAPLRGVEWLSATRRSGCACSPPWHWCRSRSSWSCWAAGWFAAFVALAVVVMAWSGRASPRCATAGGAAGSPAARCWRSAWRATLLIAHRPRRGGAGLRCWPACCWPGWGPGRPAARPAWTASASAMSGCRRWR